MKSRSMAADETAARIAPPLPRILSARAADVARMFGIDDLLTDAPQAQPHFPSALDLQSIVPRPGEMLLLSGPSGAGRTLLHSARQGFMQMNVAWIELA